jgi:AraC family transcriptional regulator of adaptative response/methylated-DNA-[protein]-cysteine methyltransferase
MSVILNKSTAARTVGSVVGKTPLTHLIPCHRVIREIGALGGYRWGEVRKQAILAWENSPCSTSARAHSI